MAYTLKTGKTYPDKQGLEQESSYAAIDEVVNSKRKKEATLVMKIYASKELANGGKDPFEIVQTIVRNWEEDVDGEVVEHNDYSDYLSPQAVAADTDEFNRAYAYWSDKKVSAGGFNFDDWESDE